MFDESYAACSKAGAAKLSFLHDHPARFFVASMIAGAFITLGSFLSMTAGGLLAPWSGAKLVAAFLFAAALSLVITAGCELFTGSNLTAAAAAINEPRQWPRVVWLWIFCWIGNLAGTWVFLGVYALGGSCSESASAYFAATAAAKCAPAFWPLVARGILCNVCVCLAIWCTFRLTSECARLVMCLWCILVFMTCGFEHSVANMSILGVAFMQGHLSLAAMAHNLLPVTLGNILGGCVFLAVPYGVLRTK